jgi:hypothetical protein
MIVNFRACGISRDAHKLTRILVLIQKNKNKTRMRLSGHKDS